VRAAVAAIRQEPTFVSQTFRTLPPRRRRVLLTGVTGFVGQAVLERFLREEAEIHVVVRGRGGESAEDRLDEVLTRAAFDPWREEVGPAGVARARSHVHVVEADLSEDLPPLPTDLDVVVHSASSVSFDDPWDVAIRANVLGPRSLYEALERAGGRPHVIHVSTSYVQTDRTDLALEASVEHDVDWRVEVDAARARRAELVAGSGVTELTGERRAAAVREADATMRGLGRERARELGWTDVYTMTKSFGERVAEELWGARGNRLTVLRPTIIESAVARPFPGWIDGFKVADPLIAAFAKGRLVAFPGHPDAVLDVVPVDLVVDAIMAATLVPLPDAAPRYLQVGTSVSNPMTLDTLRAHVEGYLATSPWVDRAGAPIRVRPWRFLSPDALDAWAGRRAAVLGGLARTLEVVPGSFPHARSRVEAARRGLRLVRSYAGIYQPYTCSRTRYDDTATRQLLADAATLGAPPAVDVRGLDWAHYIREVHMPSLTRTATDYRRRSAERRALEGRPITRGRQGAGRAGRAGRAVGAAAMVVGA